LCIIALLFIYGCIVNYILLIALPAVFYLFIFLYYGYYAYCKQNAIFFKERYYELDGEFLTGFIDDGSTARVNLSNVINLIRRKEYFLLYISKDQFVYLPFDCFKSEVDVDNFEKNMAQYIDDTRNSG
jgi:hypothetical protein